MSSPQNSRMNCLHIPHGDAEHPPLNRQHDSTPLGKRSAIVYEEQGVLDDPLSQAGKGLTSRTHICRHCKRFILQKTFRLPKFCQHCNISPFPLLPIPSFIPPLSNDFPCTTHHQLQGERTTPFANAHLSAQVPTG